MCNPAPSSDCHEPPLESVQLHANEKFIPVLPARRSGASHVTYYFTNYPGDSGAFHFSKRSLEQCELLEYSVL